MRSLCGLSPGYLGDSGFSVAASVRKSVLAPAHAAVALLLDSAFRGGGHLSGLSRRTVGAGSLQLGGRLCASCCINPKTPKPLYLPII